MAELELKTLKQLVYNADELYGDEVFLTEYIDKKFRNTSFREFRNSCDSIGAWIQTIFTEKTHIALVGATSYEYLSAWFGVQCSCNVSVPLDTNNTPENIADELARSDSKMVFLDEKHVKDIPLFKEHCPQVEYYVHLHSPAEGMLFLGDIKEKFAGKAPVGDVTEDDLAAILFTSGTTGKSKGVMLTHGNLIDNTTCCPEDNYHGRRLLTCLPIHHVFCFTIDILHSLWHGVNVCVNDSLFHLQKNLKLFEPEYCTFVPMIASTILVRMQQAAKKIPLKKMIAHEVFGKKLIGLVSGGAYLSPDIIKGFREFGIDIAQGYGMTECSPRICTAIFNCPKPDSVGKIVNRCEVKIVDGEIWAKSPSVMKGYYKNPEETANTLSEDGWLRTGDLGYKDDDGYLYITGRKKNLIILSNGENVSPEEIENKFATFRPIKEMVVYEDNQVITAMIYPDPDYKSKDIQAEIRKKIEEVNDKLRSEMRIVNIVFRDKEFVKTASRKIIRARIHE
ncbi:MAG: AMP-binding protein [Ruminiclostridium sp.]|nr:AMP-binding protein [Ruminiclostridium sp.]